MRATTHHYVYTAPNVRHTPLRLTYRLAMLFAVTFAFAVAASAQVSITVPANGVQTTSPAPLRALITSPTGANISVVKVVDGTTQIASYAGNGTPTLDIRAVLPLDSGSHTLTVTATDANGSYSDSTTFTVASNGSVTQSPLADAESPSPTNWQATCTANTGQVITAMKVYLDFPTNNVELLSFTSLNSNSVTESASLSSTQVPSGSHSLTTNCWDNAGQVYQSSVDFTVGTAFPSAAQGAVVLNMTNNSTDPWQDCVHTPNPPGCTSDGGGDTSIHSDDFGGLYTNPMLLSIDNASRRFQITTTAGTSFQGFLWFAHFADGNSTGFTNGHPSNWIMDYYVNVSNPLQNHFVLEFDGNQTTGAPTGEGYVLGTQCNYDISQTGTVWRFYDGNLNAGKGTWNTTSTVPCPLTSFGHWYHVQMYFTVNSSTFTYTLKNVRVTDTTLNSVVLDSAPNLSFKGVNNTGHGNSIDVEEDGNNNGTYPVTYAKMLIKRW